MQPPDKAFLERQRYDLANAAILAISPEALRVIAYAFGSDSDDQNLVDFLLESNSEINTRTLKTLQPNN